MDDFEVVLSDGTTKLGATFTLTSTAESSSVREFAEKTLGAVLGISDYYLVLLLVLSFSIANPYFKTYNPISPLAQRIALRVTAFKVLGCLGEKPFGRPVAIEEQENLWDIWARLDDLLENNTQEPREELDIQSQPGVCISRSSGS